MARVWGAWTSSVNSTRIRVGFDYSVSGTKVTVSQYLLELDSGWIRDNVVLQRTGKGSGTINYYFNRSSPGVSSIPNSGFSFTAAYGSSTTVGGKILEASYGWLPTVSAGLIVPPTVPGPPGKPVASNIGTRTVDISWNASTVTGGSNITGYLLRYFIGTGTSGSYVTVSEELNQKRRVSGLTPGQYYTFVVFARNSVGHSKASSPLTIKTKAGAWIKNSSGIWVMGEAFVKQNNVWKPAVPYVKVNGSWRLTQ